MNSNALNYAKARMKHLKISRYKWKEEYLKIAILYTKQQTYQFNTSDYLYFLDNGAYKNLFLNTSADNKIYIYGSYSYRLINNVHRIMDVKGLNEFTGHIRIVFYNPFPLGTETFLVLPYLKFTPIVC